MLLPFGWTLRMGAALRLNTGVPVPPAILGVAAFAVSASNDPNARAALRKAWLSSDCVFLARIAALLGCAGFVGIDRLTDIDLVHEPAEVFGIVGQMIQVRRVEKEFLAGLKLGRIACIEDYVDRFAARERDRVRVVSH